MSGADAKALAILTDGIRVRWPYRFKALKIEVRLNAQPLVRLEALAKVIFDLDRLSGLQNWPSTFSSLSTPG